jgi:hypothetical protein
MRAANRYYIAVVIYGGGLEAHMIFYLAFLPPSSSLRPPPSVLAFAWLVLIASHRNVWTTAKEEK